MQEVRILVVEDSALSTLFHKRMLTGLGYEADYCDNAEAALALHIQHPYDLILSDIKLPSMNGLSMSERIRQLEREHCLPSTNIVAITSCNLDTIKQALNDLGIEEAHNKPIESVKIDGFIEASKTLKKQQEQRELL